MSPVIDAPRPARVAAAEESPGALQGREPEQQCIARKMHQLVRHGEGDVLWIGGPAGAGKSRLVECAVEEAALAGARLLVGGGICRDGIAPLAPLLDALTGGGERGLDLTLYARAVDRDAYWLVREIGDRLEELVEKGPLVVALDDVHRCDDLTLLTVRTLTTRLARRPVLWVLAARSHCDVADAEALGRDLLAAGATPLELGALAPEAVRQMTCDLLGDRAPSADQYLRCLDGLPGVVRHACDWLAEHGGGADAGRELMSAVASRRLSQLTEDARELVLIASVLGGTLTVRHLAELLNRRESALVRPLREVFTCRLLSSDTDGLSFTHAPVREAVAGTLPRPVRLSLRRRSVGLRLNAGVPAVAVAPELAAIAEPGDTRAVMVLNTAAQELAPVSPGTAAVYLERALAISGDAPAERLRMSARLVPLLWQSGRAEEARNLGRDLVQAPPDPVTHAQVCLHLARMGGPLPLPHADGHLRQAHRHRNVPVSLKDQLLSMTLLNRVLAGEVEETGGPMADLLARARGMHPVSELTRRTLQSMNACHRQNWEEALKHSEVSAAGIAQLSPLSAAALPEVALSTAWRAALLSLASDGVAAAQLVESGLTEAERRGRQAFLPLWRALGARLLLDAGDLAAAAARIADARELPTAPGSSGASETALLCLEARVAFHRGDDTTVQACAASGTAYLAATDRLRQQAGGWLTLLSSVYRGVPATGPQLQAAFRHVRRGFLHTDCVDPGDTVFLVRAAMASGLRDAAVTAVEFAEQRARRNPRFALFQATAVHARGLLEGDAQRLAQAADSYRSTRPLLAAQADEDAGTVLAPAGETRARPYLERAVGLYATCDAHHDVRRVRGRLRRIGDAAVSERGAVVSGWRGLTPSEMGVVRLIARGATNRQAAEQLFLSPHTVNSHVRHAFEKLGVRSRVQLARLYAREVDHRADAPA